MPLLFLRLASVEMRQTARTSALVAFLIASIALDLKAQSSSDLFRGRVATDSGVAIPGADVIVTIAPSAQIVRSVTDSLGQFVVSVQNGSGEYVIYFSAVGFVPMRQRLTRLGRDTVFTVNVELHRSVTALPTMSVRAERPKPSRSLGSEVNDAGTDGMDKIVDGIQGALPPDLIGNLTAMASLVPGVTVTSGEVSAFGLSSDKNKTTLNGLSFDGAELPRGARTATRFSTSPWDPSMGGFSGVSISTALRRGGNISTRNAQASIDAPSLQFSDPVASRLGGKYQSTILNAGGAGALRLDRLFYNYGASLSRRTSAVSSLLDLDAEALRLGGISSDSAQRFLDVLREKQIPNTPENLASRRVTTSGTFVGKFDRVAAMRSDARPPTVLSLSVFGKYSESNGVSLEPSILPTSIGRSHDALLSVRGLVSTFVGAAGNYVNETSSAVTIGEIRRGPETEIPGATVLVTSDLDTGRQFGALRFGGDGNLAGRNKKWSWETINQTGLIVGRRGAVPIKISLQSRLDGFVHSPAANHVGIFTFQSISDFDDDRPSAFERTVDAVEYNGGQWAGTASMGTTWGTGNLSLTGGLRFDANIFTTTMRNNEDLTRTLGIQTDHIPNTAAVSPRLGFVWRYAGAGGNASQGTPIYTSNKSGAQLRGGIGQFRSDLASNLLVDALRSNGLAGSADIACVGSATPSPRWQEYARSPSAVPIGCDGIAAFSDTVPGAYFFRRGFSPSRSWRGTIGWTSMLRNVYVAVDGTYSLNLDQADVNDVNFSGTSKFLLDSEDGRPVYVPASSIVEQTGAPSLLASRKNSKFGRVLERASDIKGDARQLTVYMIPNLPYRVGFLSVGYTWQNVRSKARGFERPTDGDPRRAEWSRASLSPDHQIRIQGAHVFGKFGVTTFLYAQSGIPFTPLVGGDINGDGFFNDRAFVFGSDGVDTVVAGGVRGILTTGSKSGRSCLRNQVETIALRNSCSGPWTATMNATVFFFPPLPATGGRTRVSLGFANVLSGLDQAFHGRRGMRGWGTFAFPDPILYRVTGFNATAGEFKYQVNPRFGESSPLTTTVRVPFRVTLDVAIDLGRPAREQQLEQNLRLSPRSTARLTSETLKQRYLASSYSDIYASLSRLADSLALSRSQMERFEARQVVLKSVADTIFGGLGEYLAALEPGFDSKLAVKRVEKAEDLIWQAIYAEKPFLLSVLTPGQIRLLPPPLFRMLTVPKFNERFFGY